MTQFYLIPQWFFGYDIALEIFFGVITLLISLYSFRIYRLSCQRECRILGWGFLSIALGYFTWSALNIYVSSQLNAPGLEIPLRHITSIATLAAWAHIGFLVAGAATLAYMTLPSRSERSYVVFVTLSLLVVVFALKKALAFYFVSSFLMLIVISHYFVVYMRHRHRGTLLMFFAFLFVFLGNVDFIFATLHPLHYFVGHVFHLIGYLFALASLLSLLRS